MKVSRIELDGTGSPQGLVTAILKIEKELPLPVPIHELCYALDITEILIQDTDSFEGALITDTDRNRGAIIARASHPYRERYTIGHELGHFLIPRHIPNAEDRFLCSPKDMKTFSANKDEVWASREVEANRFASLMLIPPPALRKLLDQSGDPNLQHIPALSKQFEVSKEALARAYAEYHDEPIAILVVHNGIILRSYRNPTRFPFIKMNPNQKVPLQSLYCRWNKTNVASDIEECLPNLWIDVEYGKPAPKLYEQVYPQQDGYGLIMLWIEPTEDEYEDEDKTSKERLRDRQARWQ